MKKELLPIPENEPVDYENESLEERKERIKDGVEWMEYKQMNFPGEEWEIYCLIFFNTFAIGKLSVVISYNDLREILTKDSLAFAEDGQLADSSAGYDFRPADDVIKESLERMIKKELIKVENDVYSINIYHELNILFDDENIIHRSFLTKEGMDI